MSDNMSTQNEDVPSAEENLVPAAPAPPEVPEAPPAPEAVPAPAAESVEVTPPAAPAPPSAPPYTPPPPPPPPYAPPVEVMPQRPAPATESSKILAALGYLFPIIAIVVLFIEPYKDEKFVRFHAVQGIAVGVLYIVAGAITWVPIIGWLFWVVPLVLAIIGLVKAFQSEYWEMPVIYDIVKGFINQ